MTTNNGILSFGVYKEISPIVVDTIKLLEDNKNNFKNYDFLYKSTIDHLLGILSYISKGYNKYHSQEKANFYSSSRDCVSITQSNLLLISKLDLIPKDKTQDIYNKLEDKIKYLNGLIKKMESKILNKNKDN